jgi:beta-1,4-mannosyltransferase
VSKAPQPSAPGKPLRVLLDVPKSSWPGNPYVELLVEHIPGDIEILGYRQEVALEGDYDVVHLHWPEHRLAGPDLRERLRKRRIYRRWMRRLREHQIPVVRTRHNRTPHDRKGAVDRRLLEKIKPLIRGQVWLTPSSMAEADVGPSPNEVVIPHGDFRPWIATVRPDVDTSRTASGRIRLASFGALKPYKNLEGVIAVVRDSDDFSLTVAGNGRDPGYVASLTSLARDADNVEVHDGHLPDNELIDLVLGSDAVVAAYKDFYNSSVTFLALSLDRPVIVPDGPMTRELRDEFGAEWVGLYEGPLTPDGLRQAWQAIAGHEGSPTWSPQRAWPTIGRAHADLYRQVADR